MRLSTHTLSDFYYFQYLISLDVRHLYYGWYSCEEGFLIKNDILAA